MGLRQTFQSGAAAIVNAFGNVAEDVTWNTFDSGSYNTTTGAVTRTESDTTVKVIFLDYRRDEIDGESILRQDKKVIVTASHLDAIVLGINDRLTRSNGEVWEVKHIETDPAESAYVLQVRR